MRSDWDECSPEDESVLVAIVRRASDWAHITDGHWYHIPMASAPKRIAARYVAFYHPGCFPETRWTVSYYAPVRGYQVVSRRELFPEQTDHPRADALYYRIDLGQVTRLAHPIPSPRLRRITFCHTTLRRLLNAVEFGDLWQKETRTDRLDRLMLLQEPPATYCAAGS